MRNTALSKSSTIMEFIKLYIRTHLSWLRILLRKVQYHSSPKVACSIENLSQSVLRRTARFHYDPIERLYFVNEGEYNHHFSDMIRGFGLYGRGVVFRGNQLHRDYLADQIVFKREDIVVDCGANYGDFYISLKSKICPKNYISFEPGQEEFVALTKNAQGCRNFNVGLSNIEGSQVFFVSSAGADSSIIEPGVYTHRELVETSTLDSIQRRLNLTRIRLFKLEAEGFEPEILQGGVSFLKACEYVATDGGYERGVESEETLSFQISFLINHDFELVKVNLRRGTALFRRKIPTRLPREQGRSAI